MPAYPDLILESSDEKDIDVLNTSVSGIVLLSLVIDPPASRSIF